MSGVIATLPKFQFSSATGAPLANGTLTVYVAGSTTPTNTWQDYALTIANTNPITLDSRGECVLWLSSAAFYKFVLKNAAGVIQWTQDNISGAAHQGQSDSALIGFIKSDPGSASTTVEEQLRMLSSEPPYDLSSIALKQNSVTVITGDSLSYNRYDFDAVARNNGYDCYAGMKSWAFMLSDQIVSGSWYSRFEKYSGSSFKYFAAFSNEVMSSAAFGAGVVALSENVCPSPDNAYLVFACNDFSGQTGLVDIDVYIDGIVVSSLVGVDNNQRSSTDRVAETKTIALGIPAGTVPSRIGIAVKNARTYAGVANASVTLFMHGITVGSRTVKHTGHGGWRTSQILSEFSARIGSHVPDLVICITGANDRFYGTKEDYVSSLESLMDQTLAVNAGCKFLFLTAQPASDTGYAPTDVLNGSTMRAFVDAGLAAVRKKGAFTFSNYDFFRGIDPADWRFDNVHMTKRGNEMLFNAISGKYFANILDGKKKLSNDPTFSPLAGNTVNPTRYFAHSGIYTFNSSGDLTSTAKVIGDPPAIPTISLSGGIVTLGAGTYAGKYLVGADRYASANSFCGVRIFSVSSQKFAMWDVGTGASPASLSDIAGSYLLNWVEA